MMEKRNGFIEKPTTKIKECSTGNVGIDRMKNWRVISLLLGAFFLFRRCNNIPLQTWIMCAICDNTVSSFLNAWKYYHNTENVFFATTMLLEIWRKQEWEREVFVAILQTFKSCKRRKNNRRQFCFRASKGRGKKKKGRIGIYDASEH